jgi:hypothetical protein
MRRGDIVRLRQPLQINTANMEEFTHGIIAARIKIEARPLQAESLLPKATVKELIIYLYNPKTCKICLDEEGVPIFFDLQLDEVDLFKAVKKHTGEI